MKKKKFEPRPLKEIILRKPFYFIMNYDTNLSIWMNAKKMGMNDWYAYRLVYFFKKVGIMDDKHKLTDLGKLLKEKFGKLNVIIPK